MIHTTLYAHHKGVDHGNAAGGKGKVPEIDGTSIWLTVLLILCIWRLLRIKKTT
jgi:hypothetical protein